jgi:hypothetical protein
MLIHDHATFRHPSGSRGALERIAPCHTGVFTAYLPCAAPARCGAIADERRIVAATQTNGICQSVKRPPTRSADSAASAHAIPLVR